MAIEELAKEKVLQQSVILGCQMWNTYGKSVDEIAEVQMQEINARKKLHQIERQIKQYIEAA